MFGKIAFLKHFFTFIHFLLTVQCNTPIFQSKTIPVSHDANNIVAVVSSYYPKKYAIFS
jgi:hypothetical protein